MAGTGENGEKAIIVWGDLNRRGVGYLTYGTDAANMVFHVVNERHRLRRPMIFTTNKSLKA